MWLLQRSIVQKAPCACSPVAAALPALFQPGAPRRNPPALPGPGGSRRRGQGLGAGGEGVAGAGEGFRWGVKGHRGDGRAAGSWGKGGEGRGGAGGATLSPPGGVPLANSPAAAPRPRPASSHPRGRRQPAGATRSLTGHFLIFFFGGGVGKGGLPRLCLGGGAGGWRAPRSSAMWGLRLRENQSYGGVRGRQRGWGWGGFTSSLVFSAHPCLRAEPHTLFQRMKHPTLLSPPPFHHKASDCCWRGREPAGDPMKCPTTPLKPSLSPAAPLGTPTAPAFPRNPERRQPPTSAGAALPPPALPFPRHKDVFPAQLPQESRSSNPLAGFLITR